MPQYSSKLFCSNLVSCFGIMFCFTNILLFPHGGAVAQVTLPYYYMLHKSLDLVYTPGPPGYHMRQLKPLNLCRKGENSIFFFFFLRMCKDDS